MFQKKVVIPEPIPLTAKDIKNLKTKLSEKEDLSELKIKDLDMSDLLPQSLNGVIILEHEGRHCLDMPFMMDGAKFKTWRKSKGGLFNLDAIKYLRGHEYGKYLLIEGSGKRKIVRLIEDEELLMFKTLKLLNGMVKDKPFMLVKNLAPGEKLTTSERYIKKNSEHEEVEDEMKIQPTVIKPEADHESNTTSVSLFDE